MDKSLDFEAYLMQMADLPENFEDKQRLQILLNHIELRTTKSLLEHIGLLPMDCANKIQDSIVRWLCVGRTASTKHPYHKFISYAGTELTYISKFLQMEGAVERRVPRSVNGVRESELMRKKGKCVWIVEHGLELIVWMRTNESPALIARDAINTLDFI